MNGTVALWGGVNGHLTVEMSSEDQVRSEVQAAISTLSPGGGFILSPVDNVLEYEGEVVRNVKVLIDTWRELVK